MWPRRPSKEAGTLKVAKVAERVRKDEAFARLAATARLCDAAYRGDLEEVKAVLELGLDINAQDTGGRTALHYAVAQPTAGTQLIEFLLDRKASVGLEDSDGVGPLELARLRGSPGETLSALIDAGANISPVSAKRLKGHLTSDGCLISKDEVELGEMLSQTLKSSVYRAVWRGTNVAAKVVLETAQGQENDDLNDELVHEIQLLATIHHPDLVMFLGAVVNEPPVMFITEYMDGGDLERYYMAMRKEHQTPNWHVGVGQQIHWCSAIARGLCFLHNCKTPIIHRDLKPLNLLLTKLLEIKITDFGISKMTAPTEGTVMRSNTMGVGSYHYMAPEVVRSDQYDTKADIYSFALIMYFISSGRDPFWERTKDPTLILEEYGNNKQPRPQLADASPALRPIMKDAWAEEPKDRPDARELIKRLTTVPANKGCGCSTM